MVVGDCAFCLDKNVSLQNSHIIPEFFYKPIYTSKHTIKGLAPCKEKDLEVEQKGHRQYLLCINCENKFSKWESDLKWFIKDITENNQKIISITNFGKQLFVSDFNYDFIKRAILSIFWRLSKTSLKAFETYNLGIYENKIKNVLRSDIDLNDEDYPIIVSKGLLRGKFFQDIIVSSGKGRYASTYSMQSIILNGFIFDVLICEGINIPSEVKVKCLKKEGVIISNKNHEDRNLNLKQYIKRFQKENII